MSTNSTITIQHADDSCESIYCHWDGYLEWNGQLLYTFYNTADKVQELINHGDMSTLFMNIGARIDGKAFDPRRVLNLQCEFYARDRGEGLSIWKSDDISKIEAQEYNYVFNEKEGVWYVYDYEMANKQLLKDALAECYRNSVSKSFLFTADTAFNVPMSSFGENSLMPKEVSIKDIATAEQLQRLDALKADIVEEQGKKLTLTRFDCADDLSQYTDSLLFTDDEVPAVADFTDKNGNNVNLRIIVTGDVGIEFRGETYTNPDEYSDELRELIRTGKIYLLEEAGKVYIDNRNWFKLVYSITDASGEEIAYDGCAIEKELSEMTKDDLESYLANYAENLYDEYSAEIADAAKPTKKQKNYKERND